MSKTILMTGSTDGIGRAAAEALVREGHRVLLHGRSERKLDGLSSEIGAETYRADLSVLAEVDALADAIRAKHDALDVLINNAGVFATSDPVTVDKLDVRFAVNTIAPYRLTQKLMPLFGARGRVVNLSSAAQAPVDLDALTGKVLGLNASNAYAQSKLAITAWTQVMAQSVGADGPMIVSVNPGSMLATKMVKSAYGVQGADIRIGVDILKRAALSEEFEDAAGRYFDNDIGQFSEPHPAATDAQQARAIVDAIESVLSDRLGSSR